MVSVSGSVSASESKTKAEEEPVSIPIAMNGSTDQFLTAFV